MKTKLPVAKQKPIPVRIVSEKDNVPTPDANYEARERKYKAEDALRSLQRAEEVKADKGLMKDVKALATQQMKALGKIK